MLCCCVYLQYSHLLPITLKGATPKNVAGLLHLAVNKSSWIAAATLLDLIYPGPQHSEPISKQQKQLQKHLEQQPELVEHLVQTAMLRQSSTAVLQKLLQLPAAARMSTAAAAAAFRHAVGSGSTSQLRLLCSSAAGRLLGPDDVAALLKFAVQGPAPYVPVSMLVRLPAAQQVSASAVAQLLQTALQLCPGRSNTIEELISLPQAANISSSCAEQLLHTLVVLESKWVYNSHPLDPPYNPLLACLAVQQLGADALLRLVLTALQQQEYKLALDMLLGLPAAQQLTAEAMLQILAAGVSRQPGGSESEDRGLAAVVEQLLQLPGAAALQPSVMMERLMQPLMMQRSRVELLASLCGWSGLDVALAKVLCSDAINAFSMTALTAISGRCAAVKNLDTDSIVEFLQRILAADYISKLALCEAKLLEVVVLQLMQLPAAKHIAADVLAELLLKAVKQRLHLAVLLLCRCDATSDSSSQQQLTAAQLAPALELAVQLQLDSTKPDFCVNELRLMFQYVELTSVIVILASLPAAKQLHPSLLLELLEAALHSRLAAAVVRTLSELLAAAGIPLDMLQRVLQLAEQYRCPQVAATLMEHQKQSGQEVSCGQLLPLLRMAVQQADGDAVASLLHSHCLQQLDVNETLELMCTALQQESKLSFYALCNLEAMQHISVDAVSNLLQIAMQHRQYGAVYVIFEKFPSAKDIDGSTMVHLFLAALQLQRRSTFRPLLFSSASYNMGASGLQQVLDAAVGCKKLDVAHDLWLYHSAARDLSNEYKERFLLSCIQMQRPAVKKYDSSDSSSDDEPDEELTNDSKGLSALFKATKAYQSLDAGSISRLLQAAVAYGDNQAVMLLVGLAEAANQIGPTCVYELLECATRQREQVVVEHLRQLAGAQQLDANHVEQLVRIAVLQFTSHTASECTCCMAIVFLDLPGANGLSEPVLQELIQFAASKKACLEVMQKFYTVLHRGMWQSCNALAL